MILHTVANHSEIMTCGEIPQVNYINVDGCVCECVKTDNDFLIKRLISTDPSDYLRLSPGQVAFERIGFNGSQGKDKKENKH